MEFLIVVLSCKKNKHLWDDILKQGHNIIIFCGDENEKENSFRYENRVLYLSCNDFYEGLPEKIICMIDAVLKINIFNRFTHFIKIDDHDALINYERVINLSQMYVNGNDYCGFLISGMQQDGTYMKPGTFYVNRRYHFNKCSENSEWNNKEYPGIYAPYAWGGLYILSRKALVCINSVYTSNNKKEIRQNHIFEDLLVGITLNRFGIMPKYIPKMIN